MRKAREKYYEILFSGNCNIFDRFQSCEDYRAELEDENTELLKALMNEYRLSVYPPIEKARAKRLKLSIEKITGRKIDEVLK